MWSVMCELKLVTSWPPVAVTTGVTNEPDTVPRSMYRYSILAVQFPAIRPSRPVPMVQPTLVVLLPNTPDTGVRVNGLVPSVPPMMMPFTASVESTRP
jgi:hypothetical protein